MTHPQAALSILDQFVLNKPPPFDEKEEVKTAAVEPANCNEKEGVLTYAVASEIFHVLLALRIPRELIVTTLSKPAPSPDDKKTEEPEAEEVECRTPLKSLDFFIGPNHILHQDMDVQKLRESKERYVGFSTGPLPTGALYQERCLVIARYEDAGRIETPAEDRRAELVGVIYGRAPLPMVATCSRYLLPIRRTLETKGDVSAKKRFIEVAIQLGMSQGCNNLLLIENGRSHVIYTPQGDLNMGGAGPQGLLAPQQAK